MSKIIEIINKIFDERFIQTSHDSISEPKEKMKRRILKGGIIDEKILICHLDIERNAQVSDLFPYLRGDSLNHGFKGMKRVCDYAIFVEEEETLFVLLIELKKGKESSREQLEVSEPLIDFIFSRARILKHLNTNYTVRKIGITDVVEKKETINRGEVIYDENNYTKLYNSNILYLRKLLH